MRKLITVLLLFATKISLGQSDNYLNWRNAFPSNAERLKETNIYSDGVKLSYDKTLMIKSSGSNDVNETNLRNNDSYVRKHIYDADIEMKFTFEKGASPGAAVGMAFSTYRSGAGRVISYRFLVSADGRFYSFIDSADYSTYKKDLRQFKSQAVTPKLLIDGSENKFVITRHPNYWRFFVNGVEVDSLADTRFYPFNPANDIRFLFAGKYTLQLNSLKEDYALFQNSINDELKKVKVAEGSGYKIENLNTKTNDVMDNNASLSFNVAFGDLEATISSPVFEGNVKIRIARNSDGTYEKNNMPARIGEYEVTEFTLDAQRKNWYLKAEKKDYSGTTKETDFTITTRTIITTTSLWMRGSK